MWPGTKEYVDDRGWLRRFLDTLVENRSWLSIVTPSEALDQVPPIGKVYIPEGSYREIVQYRTFAEAAAPLCQEPGKYPAKAYEALLVKITYHTDNRPPTPYREAIIQVRRRVEAARRGESAPALPQDEPTPVTVASFPLV